MPFAIWIRQLLMEGKKLKWSKEDLTAALSLYLVTDRTWLKNESLSEVVEEAILNGVTMVQLREKNLGREEF
ncbi:MAG: thiamine phosphate synthase, partial [Clostridiales bacterium]